MTKNNRSILISAYLYGGETGTSSVRSTRFSEEFRDYFDNVFVITKESVTTSDGISVYPVKCDSVREKLKKTRSSKFIDEDVKKSAWYKFAFKVMISFPTNLLFADANIFHIMRAVRIGEELIEKHNITHIFSSRRPYGDHYIAYLLKKKYPHLKWIADFRDLYIEPVYKTVYFPSFQRLIERKILAQANIVTTVSEGLVSHLRKYDRPTFNIMRGMERRPVLPYFNKFTITYTGSLYQDFRDPRPVFKVLNDLYNKNLISLSDISIVYAGKDQGVFEKWVNEYGLQDTFKGLGLITRQQSQEIQSKSHINLLLTSSSSEWQGVLTGKVFEYIECGNATICMIKGVKDLEFEELFKELNAGIVAYQPEIVEGELEKFLLQKYDEWKITGTVKKVVNFERILSDHSWKARVNKILKLVSQ